MSDNKSEKYQELYQLSKEVLHEEDVRNSYLEDKASKYIPALVVLFGGFGFFSEWAIKELLPISSPIEACIVVLIFTTILIALFASIKLFSVLKQKDYLVRPVDVDFFDGNDLPAIYRTLSIKNGEAAKKNRKNNDIKSKKLGKGHFATLVSMFLFGLILAIFAINSGTSTTFVETKKESKIMPNDQNSNETNNTNDSSSDTSSQQQDIPVPDTQPQSYDTVKKSDDSPISKRLND